ncbi:hypothetical protein [Lichenibacterium dinghuense]|uniref:hypothetical protein n=1 Tax=Lichenibacterium dinghuense TaxID=2895977 RepID=UPI001F3E625D|nr:hypothetical protein [Lichenibacterium sp. 6Y81]
MIADLAPLLPDHRLLNEHRRRLQERPDLTDLDHGLAQRLAFVSLLDLLATAAPYVAMDDLVEAVLDDVADAALGPEPGELCGTACDVLSWIEPPAEESGGRYSLRLVQYLGALLDRYGDPANPPHLVGLLQVMMDFLPEPSVLDLDRGAEVNRISPSLFGRGHLGWSGSVCLPAGPCR